MLSYAPQQKIIWCLKQVCSEICAITIDNCAGPGKWHTCRRFVGLSWLV